MDDQTKRKRIQWLRNLPPMFSLMLVVAFGIVFYKLSQKIDLSAIRISSILSVLSPFIIGLVLTFFLVPPVKFVERQFSRLACFKSHYQLTNLLSILISYVVIFGIVIIVLVYVMPQVFAGLSTLLTLLIDALQSLYNNLEPLLADWDESSWSSLISGKALRESLGGILTSLTANLEGIAGTVFPKLYQTISSIAAGSLNTLVGLIVSIYLIADRKNVAYSGKRALYAFFKKERATQILNLAQEILTIFRRFFVGKIVDSLIIGILCYILMKILGLPYAELISVIVGITNVIPFFGPFIGAIPSILIILMSSPMEALIFAVLILALQQLDGNVIGPAILGNSLGLKPIWIVFSVTVGGGLFGLVGMIAGVPAFTVIYTLFKRYVSRRLQTKNLNTPEQLQEAESSRQQDQPSQEIKQ
jgi:predicted PurR-regulated permease PerM